MRLYNIVVLLALVAICWTFSSCGTTVRYGNTQTVEPAGKQGPPPHAPAHGYRHKHGNTVLVYDSKLDVYLVKGHPNYFFYHNRYYRDTDRGWEITAHFEGPWKSVSTSKLPKGLKKSEYAKSGKKNKNKKK